MKYTDEDLKKFGQEKLDNWLKLKEELLCCDALDEDGYPTDAALDLIENWHYSDFDGMLKFIESIWHLKSFGWSIDEENNLHLSTAGWSGNESIIHAMKQNFIFWSLYWEQSRRGGHHIFCLNDLSD